MPPACARSPSPPSGANIAVPQHLNEQGSGCVLELLGIKEVHMLVHRDTFAGYTVAMEVRDSNGAPFVLEGFTEAAPANSTLVLHQERNNMAARTLDVQVGLEWEAKEWVFQRWGGLVGAEESPGCAQLWKGSKDKSEVTVLWMSPHGVLAETQRQEIKKDEEATQSIKPTPLGEHGLWSVRVMSEGQVIASRDFIAIRTQLELAGEYPDSGLVQQFWHSRQTCWSGATGPSCISLPRCADVAWSSLSRFSDVA